MNHKEIMDRMLEIQNKYNNNSDLFQQDKEFIELAGKLKYTKRKRVSINKIIIEENKNE